jgi:hypothetical protein
MVYRYNRVLLIVVGMTIPTVSWSAETLGVRFSWAGTMACSTSPPAFTITNIPKGTKYLVFKLVDHDAPDFVHGGGQIPYSGSGRCMRVRFRILGHVRLKALSTRMNGLFALWMIQAAKSSLRVLQRGGSRQSDRERTFPWCEWRRMRSMSD